MAPRIETGLPQVVAHVLPPAGDIPAVQAQAISLHAALRALRAAIVSGAPHADLLRAAEAAEAAFDDLADGLDQLMSQI